MAGCSITSPGDGRGLRCGLPGRPVTVIGRENLLPLADLHLQPHFVYGYAAGLQQPAFPVSNSGQAELVEVAVHRMAFESLRPNSGGRGKRQRSIAGLNRAIRVLKSGMPLFIFPEGGRTKDGRMQPFMRGPAYISIRARVPLVPMALIGTYELLPIHTHHFRPRPVKLVIGKPIDPVRIYHPPGG